MANTKHTTIYDVAEQAGVSIQTVSRVLNSRPDVSVETRQRIQDIIDQMGYQPFSNARGLASKRTYTLGLVAADFSDFWFSQVVTGAEKVAHEHGYFFMLGSSSCNPEDEPKFIRLLTERHVDGILFIRASCADESEHLNRLKESGIPVVTTGNYLPESGLAMVDVDNIGGGRKATEYLLGLGHTRIAMLTGPSDWRSACDRTEGYLQALQTIGVPANPDLIKEGTWLHKSGYLGMKALLEHKIPFTAVFAQNDRIARGAISALHETGRRIPEDVSIIGYDDIPEAEFSDPPLTTIRQPMEEIGRAATRLLVQIIEDQEATPNQILFDTELIVRSSCSRLEQ
jgi:LacI family transcriptional regulator